MTEIRVPTLGESVTEATIGQWFKQRGDVVALDEPLLELETDKVAIEVVAPEAGVLSSVVAQQGETVALDALLGEITAGEGGEAAEGGVTAEAKTPAGQPAVLSPDTSPQAPAPDISLANAPLSPAPRRVIEEHNLDARAITGTGKAGRITKGDALAALNALKEGGGAAGKTVAPDTAPVSGTIARAPEVARDMGSREERVKMTRLRQTIARRLKESQDRAAMLTTFNDVDMSAVMAVRKQYKDLFEKKHGVKLGFMSLFTKACVAALKEIPDINAEIDGTDIIYKNHYDIGVAVGTDKGLVVPVVRDADLLSLAGIEKEINRLAGKAREGKLALEDMQGGTFTISNGGVYGSMLSTPILNAPQSGILGMHRIEERPVARDGAVVIRPMMYLALSYDHRIVDGKGAVTFLVRVKENLEDPQRLLLDL